MDNPGIRFIYDHLLALRPNCAMRTSPKGMIAAPAQSGFDDDPGAADGAGIATAGGFAFSGVAAGDGASGVGASESK